MYIHSICTRTSRKKCNSTVIPIIIQKQRINWNLLETFISIYKDIYKYLNIRKIEICNIFRMYIACETHNYLYIEKAIVHIFRVYVSF